MQATNEIRNILAKGQAESRSEPVGRARRHHERRPLGAVAGSIGMGDSSAYAKMAKLRTDACRGAERSGNEAYDRLRNAAAQIRKNLITLHGSRAGNPTSPASARASSRTPPVVAELVSTGGGARIELTAFTAKVGLVQGTRATRPSTSWPTAHRLAGARSPRCGRVLRSLRLVAVYNRMRTKVAGRPQPAPWKGSHGLRIEPLHRSRLPPQAAGRRRPTPCCCRRRRQRGARGYHGDDIYPEYFKIDGAWLLAEDSRMDCVPVCEDGRIFVREFRHIRAGDAIDCAGAPSRESRASTSTRPGSTPRRTARAGWPTQGATPALRLPLGALARDGVLPRVRRALRAAEARREHGYVVWVMVSVLVQRLLAHGVLQDHRGGLRRRGVRRTRWPHDLEGSYFPRRSAGHRDLGEPRPLWPLQPPGLPSTACGCTAPSAVHRGGAGVGRHHARVGEEGRAYVLAGSILTTAAPCVLGNAYDAQDAMRSHLRKATTVVCMAIAAPRRGQHDAIVPRARL